MAKQHPVAFTIADQQDFVIHGSVLFNYVKAPHCMSPTKTRATVTVDSSAPPSTSFGVHCPVE
jgi:hypothetical protein